MAGRWLPKGLLKVDPAKWELLASWLKYGGCSACWDYLLQNLPQNGFGVRLGRKDKTMPKITVLGRTKGQMFIGE